MNQDLSKKRTSRLRFSLRGMLVVFTAVALWLGWQANRASQQRRAVAYIEAHGGSVAYDWEFNDSYAEKLQELARSRVELIKRRLLN